MSLDEIMQHAASANIGPVPPAAGARERGGRQRRRRQAGVTVASMVVACAGAGAVWAGMGTDNGVDPAGGAAANLIVTRPDVDYPFSGDESAVFNVEAGCVYFGGRPTAFPIGSELIGSELHISGMRPKVVNVGEAVTLGVVTNDLSQVDVLNRYLTENARRAVENCATRVEASEYVVVM